MQALDILQRSEWKARTGRPLQFIPDDEWNGIEVHHSAGFTAVGSDFGAKLRAIQNDHIDNNGWRDIFYGYLIHPNGEIGFGRGRTLSTGTNNTHLTVCFLGNFEEQLLTEAALNAFQRLRAAFLQIAPQATSLTYHGQRAATACPGEDIKDNFHLLALPPLPPQDGVDAPNPPTGDQVEQFINRLEDVRVDVRKMHAAYERQEAALENIVEEAGSSLGAVRRQKDRAGKTLAEVDALLELIGKE